jgi:hypothetical protein
MLELLGETGRAACQKGVTFWTGMDVGDTVANVELLRRSEIFGMRAPMSSQAWC